MGCDIHLHTEVKIGDVWYTYSSPFPQRSYALFGKMAGVRGSETPVSPPKGLPKDMGVVTALSAKEWGADGHSHSWLNAEEIAAVHDWQEERMNAWRKENPKSDYTYPEKEWGYCFGSGWDAFHKYKGLYGHSIPKKVQDIRWVFWFDN